MTTTAKSHLAQAMSDYARRNMIGLNDSEKLEVVSHLIGYLTDFASQLEQDTWTEVTEESQEPYSGD